LSESLNEKPPSFFPLASPQVIASLDRSNGKLNPTMRVLRS
jgi:hypothetical protein